MHSRILFSSLLLAGLGYACVSGRHQTQAEEKLPAEAASTERTADTGTVNRLQTDVRMATKLALMVQEEIGWNEFVADRVVDPEVQKLVRNITAARQRLLSDLRAFAPDATRDGYLNKTAKDARTVTDIVATTESRTSNRVARSTDRKRQGPEIDRLATPSRLDRRSAELARIASYRGSVIAAIRNSTGLQSPVINPPADNLVSNPAGILPGVTEGGSLNPPVAGVKAPGANSAAAVGVGAVAAATAVPATGVPANSGVGAVGSNVQAPGATAAGANAGNSPSGLLSGPAAGVQGPQSGTTSSKNPTGLLSGPAAGTPGPQSGNTSSKNPTGLLSGPAAGVQGPQSGNTASQNPTGLLSGPAAGNNSNATATAAAANGPTGLLSGPGAGVQGPQSGTTTSQNPTGLLSGPAAGTPGPQSGTTSSKNPSGLLSGPAAGLQNSSATANSRAGNVASAASGNGTTTADGLKNQTAVGVPTVDADGNVLTPAIGVVGDGEVVTAGDGNIAPAATTPTDAVPANEGVRRATESTASDLPAGSNREYRSEAAAAVSTASHALANRSRNSADRDFDVVQVERQLAVQSLAGSKRLLDQSASPDVDLAYLRQELILQKDLLDHIIVFQRYASHDLNEALAKAERTLLNDLSTIRRLVERSDAEALSRPPRSE